MADKFKKGDVVVMKSGGPPMTVDELPSVLNFSGEPRGYYEVCWFKGASSKSGRFSEHLLEEYVKPTKK